MLLFEQSMVRRWQGAVLVAQLEPNQVGSGSCRH